MPVLSSIAYRFWIGYIHLRHAIKTEWFLQRAANKYENYDDNSNHYHFNCQ